MDPFDEGYIARREKQIQDMYMMRAMTGAVGGIGLLGLLIVFFMRDATWAPIALIVSLTFVLAAFLMLVISTAQRAADKAIQREHERLMELYSRGGMKRKRDDEAAPFRLSDDGEIEAGAGAQESPRSDKARGR